MPPATQRHELIRQLSKRQVNLVLDLRRGVGVEPEVLDVTHHAHDLDRLIETRTKSFRHGDPDALADRILAGKEALGHHFIDDHRPGLIL